ncbi:MAG: hypothetical protein WEE66_05400 [Actinomycetota bacterium]
MSQAEIRAPEVVSALYPAVLRPYRSLGYEMAGTFTKHRVELDAIPPQARAFQRRSSSTSSVTLPAFAPCPFFLLLVSR